MPMTSRGQVTIEKTPSYFVAPSVAERVYNMSRDIRLLVVVRDPVTRALSDFTQAASKRRHGHRSQPSERLRSQGGGVTSRPSRRRDDERGKMFERRVFVDVQRTVVDTSWSAINIGLYSRHLRHWLELFPRRQIHVVDGERLITDPASELIQVESFLDLRPVIVGQHFYLNTTKGFPCVRRNKSVRCLGKTKGRVHPTVDEHVLTRLRQFYRPFNTKFYQMTGIEFGWH